MKVAVIGSRSMTINNLEDYLPDGITEIISGGAKGIDRCAKIYAESHNIKLIEFLPEYAKYRRNAPLKRNEKIVDRADIVIAFWDGNSRGTKYTVDYAHSIGKEVLLTKISCQKCTGETARHIETI